MAACTVKVNGKNSGKILRHPIDNGNVNGYIEGVGRSRRRPGLVIPASASNSGKRGVENDEPVYATDDPR